MPGATPNETTSANESSCFPISEVALNSLATKPSRKSMMAASAKNPDAHQIFSGM